MRIDCMQATSTFSMPTHSYSLPAGGDSGIGRETARALASFNAHVVIANKNKEKAKQAVQMIQAESPEAKVEALHVDLASLRCGVVWPVGHAHTAEWPVMSWPLWYTHGLLRATSCFQTGAVVRFRAAVGHTGHLVADILRAMEPFNRKFGTFAALQGHAGAVQLAAAPRSCFFIHGGVSPCACLLCSCHTVAFSYIQAASRSRCVGLPACAARRAQKHSCRCLLLLCSFEVGLCKGCGPG